MLIELAHGQVRGQAVQVDGGLHGAGGVAGYCARSPAMRPVSRSPLPPLPMPGLPVVLTATRPSGCAMSVRAPLSTSVTPMRVAKLRAV